MTGSTEVSQKIMDKTLRNFLRTRVNSFIKWDLIRFFHDNPRTRDTAENIARYTGRDGRDIVPELDDLVKVKVLQTENVGELRIYALSDDSKVRGLIDRFMEACHDREFRVKAIHHVIEGMHFSPDTDF